MYFSSFFISCSIVLLRRKVYRSEAYSLITVMSLCIPATVFDSSESCFKRLSIFDLISSSASFSSFRIFYSSVSKWEFILARICLNWSWNICRCCRKSDRFCSRFLLWCRYCIWYFVKLCSISSSNVDVFDVLVISRIEKKSYTIFVVRRNTIWTAWIDKTFCISCHDLCSDDRFLKYLMAFFDNVLYKLFHGF